MCASFLPQVELPEFNYLSDFKTGIVDTLATDEDFLPSETGLDDESAVVNMSFAVGDDDLSKIVNDFKEKFKDDLTVTLQRKLMKIDFSFLLQPPLRWD